MKSWHSFGIPFALWCSATVACTGSIEEAPGSDSSVVPGGAVDSLPNGNGLSQDPAIVDPITGGPIDVADPSQLALESGLQRLTARQYKNSIRDVLGVELSDELHLEQDYYVGGFAEVGGREVAISRTGLQDYNQTALEVARAASRSEALRSGLCSPATSQDRACLEQVVEQIGARLFRRPLSDVERTRYTDLGAVAASTTDDFWRGVEYVLSGMLLSPKFLYHVEIGEATAAGRRLTSFELASRLSLLLWNTAPDADLTQKAVTGQLYGDQLTAQVDRLLADTERTRDYVGAFADGLFALRLLDTSRKDPALFPDAGSDLNSSMKRAVHLLTTDIALDQNTNFTTIFDPGYAFVDARLADVYGVSVDGDGFERIDLDPTGVRVGLLTEPAVLAGHARERETSPTLRGIFVNELLCNEIPEPPANVNTALSERVEGTTKREQLQEHMENPACEGCHRAMDLVGFGLEHFDALGQARTEDNGVDIDASGELLGMPFDGPRELSKLVQNHPRLSPCLVEQAYTHAFGHRPQAVEDGVLQALSAVLVQNNLRLLSLTRAMALSDIFQRAPDPAR